MESGEAIASALGGHRVGAGWMACCPAHDDCQPSLAIRDGDDRVLVHCHAGCTQQEVIAALERNGLWQSAFPADQGRARSCDKSRAWAEEEAASRTEAAHAIWRTTVPAGGTLAGTYLVARGLTLPVPQALRFHPDLKHPGSGRWPCMVALVTRGKGGTPVAIHRTFLAGDGSRKAPVDPAKMMLGPCRGGAVRLGEPGNILMVGEGIETCLSAVQATGLPAWAALSTSGLRSLDLPESVHQVIVLADGDEPGERAAWDCASRWIGEGRRVRIARAPQGMDFNDMLLGKSPASHS